MLLYGVVDSLWDLEEGESGLCRVRWSWASASWRSSGRPGQGRAADTAPRLQCAAPDNRHVKSCILASPATTNNESSADGT